MVTANTFDEIVYSSGKTTLLEFYAPWSALARACRAQASAQLRPGVLQVRAL